MKRETLRHPKTLDLSARLSVERPTVLGYLTLLWDFTAEFAPAGNIGKFPDGAIARACEFDGDATLFVDSLVASGWLDRDAGHRLLIHDWAHHCERWVKAKLEKLKIPFAEPSTTAITNVEIATHSSAEATTEKTTERTTEATVEPSPPRDQSKPIQTKPKPNQAERTADAVADLALPSKLDCEEFRSWWSRWLAHRSEIRKPLKLTQAKEQLDTFTAWGPDRSVAAMRYTIRMGWQGIREEETRAGPAPSQSRFVVPKLGGGS